jgi:hypothetical protein
MAKMFYLHIGFPKTGSTTLQDELFPLFDSQLLYLGKYNSFFDGKYHMDAKKNKLLNEIRQFTTWKYNFDLRNQFNLLNNLKKHYPYYSGQDILLSDEDFVISSIIPKPSGVKSTYTTFSLIGRIKKLKELAEQSGFELKIIMNSRNHADFLLSFFAEFSPRLSRIKINNYKEFLDYLVFNCDSNEMEYILHYEKLTKSIQEVVGVNNFRLIPFELMSTRPDLYLNMFYDFLSIPIEYRFSNILQKAKNVRQTATGKIMKQEPILHQLKAKFGFKNVSFFGIGKLFKNYKTKKHFLNNDEEIVKKIKKHYELSNIEFIKMHPKYPELLIYLDNN